MNRPSIILALLFFLSGLSAGNGLAAWSLLEDFQMNDIAGDEGVCLSSLKDECDFDIQIYGVSYSEDDLKDDMDEARQSGLEMIYYDYSFKHPLVPFPGDVPTIQEPVWGDPFFQSDWFSPDLSGWENLAEHLLDSLQYQ